MHAVKGPCVAVHVMEVRHAGAGHMVVGQLSDHSLPVDVKEVVVGCGWWFKVVIYIDLRLAHIIVCFLTVKSYTNFNSIQDKTMSWEQRVQDRCNCGLDLFEKVCKIKKEEENI